MIPAVLITALVNCTAPRIEFKDFYQRFHGRYPGQTGEQMSSVNERVATAMADYADYAVQYAVKCR